MKLVSNNDPAVVERERLAQQTAMAHERYSRTVALLFAELLRIAAGGGKVHEAGHLIAECVHRMVEFDAAVKVAWGGKICRIEPIWTGVHTPDGWERLQSIGTEADRERWSSDGTLHQERATDYIVTAVFRLYAGRLLGQKSQEHKAQSDLFWAIDQWNEAVATRRRLS